MQGGTMQAIRQETLGGPDVLKLVTVPRPGPRGTELRVRVARAFPLEKVARAHELGESGKSGGKMVLTIAED